MSPSKSSPSIRERRALLAFAATLAAALCAAVLPLNPAPAAAATTGTSTGTAYYVDCAASSDGGGSQTAPFNSLADVNALTLQPGDSVLFDRGTTCLGSFTPHGSGTAAAPILVDAYGSGALPAIDADGATQAVLLSDESYLHLRNLSLSAPGDNTTARRGVYVYAADAGTLPGIVLQDLDIHDVRGALPAKTTTGNGTGKYANASGGIVVEAQGSTPPPPSPGCRSWTTASTRWTARGSTPGPTGARAPASPPSGTPCARQPGPPTPTWSSAGTSSGTSAVTASRR